MSTFEASSEHQQSMYANWAFGEVRAIDLRVRSSLLNSQSTSDIFMTLSIIFLLSSLSPVLAFKWTLTFAFRRNGTFCGLCVELVQIMCRPQVKLRSNIADHCANLEGVEQESPLGDNRKTRRVLPADVDVWSSILIPIVLKRQSRWM